MRASYLLLGAAAIGVAHGFTPAVTHAPVHGLKTSRCRASSPATSQSTSDTASLASSDIPTANPFSSNHAPAWMMSPRRSTSDDAALWEAARATVAEVERQAVSGGAEKSGLKSEDRDLAWAAARAAVENVERERAAAEERERELEMPVLAPLFRARGEW